MRNPKYLYHCTIPWTDRRNPMFYWDDLCANAVELFGMPGDRYINILKVIKENGFTSYNTDVELA